MLRLSSGRGSVSHALSCRTALMASIPRRSIDRLSPILCRCRAMRPVRHHTLVALATSWAATCCGAGRLGRRDSRHSRAGLAVSPHAPALPNRSVPSCRPRLPRRAASATARAGLAAISPSRATWLTLWCCSVKLAHSALYTLLQNRLYRGEIAHKGVVYPGEHAAIIDQDLWDTVQPSPSAS